MNTPAVTKISHAWTWASIVLFVLAAANLVVFDAILLILRPFWLDAENLLNPRWHTNLPWAAIFMALALAVAATLILGAWQCIRKRRSRPVHPAWALFPIASMVIADFLLALLLTELGPEFPTLEYSAVELLPYAAILSSLIIFILVLPHFACWRRAAARWLTLAGVVLVFGILALTPFPPKMVAGPWLQFVEDNGVTVCWMTDRPATGWVEYGEGFKQRAHRQQYGLIDAGTRIHRVPLKGLTPGAKVPYRTVSKAVEAINPTSARFGPTVRGEAHFFSAPDPGAESVTFVLISDLHENTALLPDLLEAADVKHCDFVVFDGDTFNHVDSEYQIVTRLLRPATALFASEIPFVFVRGNHEARGALARSLQDHVSLPDSPFVSTLRLGPAAFLVLDTGEDKPDSDVEYSGLNDFAACHAQQNKIIEPMLETPAWTSAPFHILLRHIPPYSIDQPVWERLLHAPGIDLAIAGHQHATSYGKAPNGYPVLVSSGAAWDEPGAFPAAVVTVSRDKIAIRLVTRSGAQAGQWEILRRARAGQTALEEAATVP